MHIKISARMLANVFIRGGAAVFALVSQIWIINIVGVVEYGQYAKFVSLVSFLSVFCKGGYETYVTKKYAELELCDSESDAAKILFSCLLNVLSWTIILLIASTLSKSIGFDILPEQSIVVCFLGVAFLSQYMVCISAMRALHNYIAAELIEAILKPLLMVIACYFVFVFGGSSFFGNSIILSYLVINGALVFFLFGLVLMKTSSLNNFFSPGATFQWGVSIKSHMSFVIYGLLSLVFFQLDTYFVGVICGDVVVAAYNMACNFVRIVIFIPLILFVYMQPKLASLRLAHDNCGARNLIRNYTLVSIFCAVGGVVFLVFGGRYFLLKVNDEFEIAVSPLIILSFAHVINAALIIFNGVLLIYERNDDVIRAHALGAVVALLGYVLLINKLGVIGAPMAVFFGLLTVAVYYFFKFKISWSGNVFLSKIE